MPQSLWWSNQHGIATDVTVDELDVRMGFQPSAAASDSQQRCQKHM